MKHEELGKKLCEISESLGKDGVMVCVFKADEVAPGILIYGTKSNIIASLAIAQKNNDTFREAIATASKINLLLASSPSELFGADVNKENAQQEADRLAKDFLRNNGFKMEGE